MTKKDYELIAGAIKRSVSDLIIPADDGTIEHIVYGLSTVLEGQNELFDREKFLEACGVNQGKPKEYNSNKDTLLCVKRGCGAIQGESEYCVAHELSEENRYRKA